MSSNETDEMLALIALAEAEGGPTRLRTRLRQLAADAAEAPSLVWEELSSLARQAASEIPTDLPDSDLHRVVALETFQRHCTLEEWRPSSIGSEEFRRHVERQPDPDQFLRTTLSSETVFPASHSWLVRSLDIEMLSGEAIVNALQLDQQRPPFVLCRLAVARMKLAGVRVRRPTGYDAVLGRHTIWSATGIPGGQEFVDLDIPGGAIEATLWRP